MMKHCYIGEFDIDDDHRAGMFVVNLTGKLNKCGIIPPTVPINDIERWTKLLPSRQFTLFCQSMMALWTMKKPEGTISKTRC